ncbi:DUF2333 family protein [Onishia taeanensis]
MPLFGSRKARPTRPTDILERPDYGWVWKPLLGLVAAYLVVTLVLGAWWSLAPEGFDVQRASAEQRGRLSPEPLASNGNGESAGNAESASTGGSADEAQANAQSSTEGNVEGSVEASSPPLDTSPAGRGAVIIATQLTLLETLLDKPGGYLRNDMLPPGLWLDNMPAWELGVLRQARGLAHALVENGAGEEGALTETQERLDGDSKDWLYPSTEHRLGKARDGYATVLEEFNDQRRALPAEGDVPAYWLSRVARRLDELTYRLSASVADPEALRELEVDIDQLPGPTPWYRVDDIFFEARGQAWAIEHLLAAMVADYGDVVAAADAGALIDRLYAELEQAQRRLWSPVVLNGTGFGVFANHSLMMAAYTQRAAQLAEALSGRLAGVSAPEAQTPTADEALSPDVNGEEQASAVGESGQDADAGFEAEVSAMPESPDSESPGSKSAGGESADAKGADEEKSDAEGVREPSADSAAPEAEPAEAEVTAQAGS